MQKSLKAFAKEKPQRAQDLGVTGHRARRAAKMEYSDGSDSDSDETDEPKKLKSKFFRATEKDREEEKRILDSILGRDVYDNRIRPSGLNGTGKNCFFAEMIAANVFSICNFIRCRCGHHHRCQLVHS